MRVIGLDPGKRTGIALVDWPRGEVLRAWTVSGADALDTIRRIYAETPFEGAVVQTPIFAHGLTPRWHPSPVSLAKNAALSGEIIGCLKMLCRVMAVSPKRGSGMKMTRNWFHQVYGTSPYLQQRGVRLSEHARDAVNLAMQWTDTARRLAPRGDKP